jgi:hypothetical protein
VANFSALSRELTGTTFGELSRHCAEAVLKNYSIAFFEAARRQKAGVRAGFPRRKQALVAVRFRWGSFSLDGSRVRLVVARGAPELWVRLGRAVPYPVESLRSVTLVAEAGRLYLDVTAEVPVAIESKNPDRNIVAGIDLGIIHPYAVMAGDEGLLVSGREIRAEERLHLEDTKRRAQKAAAKAPSKGQRGSRRWRRYRAARKRAEARHRRRVRQAHHEASKSVVAWLVERQVGTVVMGDPKGITTRDCGHRQNLALRKAAHLPAGVPVGQGGARGDQGRARERAGDVVHLPGVPQGSPQAEGTLFLLPALRAPVPPRSGRCPEHRRQRRRIHACTRTRHAPSGRDTPGTA